MKETACPKVKNLIDASKEIKKKKKEENEVTGSESSTRKEEKEEKGKKIWWNSQKVFALPIPIVSHFFRHSHFTSFRTQTLHPISLTPHFLSLSLSEKQFPFKCSFSF